MRKVKVNSILCFFGIKNNSFSKELFMMLHVKSNARGKQYKKTSQSFRLEGIYINRYAFALLGVSVQEFVSLTLKRRTKNKSKKKERKEEKKNEYNKKTRRRKNNCRY